MLDPVELPDVTFSLGRNDTSDIKLVSNITFVCDVTVPEI